MGLRKSYGTLDVGFCETYLSRWIHLSRTFGIILVTLSVLNLVRQTSSHPQCLDFQPPFKPTTHLEFCNHYDNFGCCDQDADSAIAERYWDLMDFVDLKEYERCGDEVKDIMCQVIFLKKIFLYMSEGDIIENDPASFYFNVREKLTTASLNSETRNPRLHQLLKDAFGNTWGESFNRLQFWWNAGWLNTVKHENYGT